MIIENLESVSKGVRSGEECRSWRSASGQGVQVIQNHSLCRQRAQVGSWYSLVIPGYVVHSLKNENSCTVWCNQIATLLAKMSSRTAKIRNCPICCYVLYFLNMHTLNPLGYGWNSRAISYGWVRCSPPPPITHIENAIKWFLIIHIAYP